MVDGSEIRIPAEGYSSWIPLRSPDSKQLIYDRKDLRTGEHQLMIWSSQSHDEEPLTGAIKTFINDWSPDGKWLLAVTGGQVWLIPFSSFRHGETAAQKIVSNPAYLIYQPHFSPDGRWVVFEAVANSPNPESALYVVPVSGGPWTRITDGRHWDDKPRWSPEGRTIYFISGARRLLQCLGNPLRSGPGKAIGQPFQVRNSTTSA